MCGIAGYINIESSDTLNIGRLKSALMHRGADHFGSYKSDRHFLFSSRFSVRGDSFGNQPFTSPDGQTVVVYNGEIYNYLDLKKELEVKGYKFKSSCDGEILPALFNEYGKELGHRLNGDFAIAILDLKQESLHLIRDRFGVRPIFYQKIGKTVWFGSEAKAIFAMTGKTPSLSEKSIDSFMFMGFLPSPLSMFDEVQRVPASSVCSFSKDGSVSVEKFWEHPAGVIDYSISASQAREKVNELLDSAIGLRMESDRPVGVFLSGGIDSSAVSYIGKKHNSAIRAYTLDFAENGFSEAQEALEYGESIGIDVTSVLFSPDKIPSILPKMVSHAELPLLTTGPAAFYDLARAAKRDVGVVLGGEGADELFWGYGHHRLWCDYRWMKHPLGSYLKGLYKKIAGKKKSKYLFPNGSQLDSMVTVFGSELSNLVNGLDLGGDVSRLVGRASNIELAKVIYSDLKHSISSLNKYDQLSHVEFYTWLENHLLVVNGDRPSMAATLETRYPFLDHRLVEYVAKVPPHLKFTRPESKVLLRDAFKSGLPCSRHKTIKRPFVAPKCKALIGHDGKSGCDYSDYLTSESTIRKKGYFCPDKFEKTKIKLRELYSTRSYNRESSYGVFSKLESAYMMVLTTHILDEAFVKQRTI